MIGRNALGPGLALFIVVLGGVLVSGASAAPTPAPPTLRLVSTCTEQERFAVQGVVSGLEPNTTYSVLAFFVTGGSAGTRFTTDGTGAARDGSIQGTSPFEVRVVIWLDPDSDITLDPGEPTTIDQTFVVDRACEDAKLKQPTTNADCKNGGWQTFGVFKNQGDCVSFVATKGKNEPTSSP